jgi:serine/threonine protein kinase
MKEIMTQLVFYENEVNFKHCSILKMKDFFNVKGFYYVIYDKPGDALGYLDPGASLNESHVYQMAYSLFAALNLMHSLNIVHSKLNLESIYFSYENTTESLKLTVGDFERCYFEHDKTPKPWFDSFSAPEMIFEGLTEKRSDYWSFACVIFFLATGKHLFPTNSKAGLAYMVRGCLSRDREV